MHVHRDIIEYALRFSSTDTHQQSVAGLLTSHRHTIGTHYRVEELSIVRWIRGTNHSITCTITVQYALNFSQSSVLLSCITVITYSQPSNHPENITGEVEAFRFSSAKSGCTPQGIWKILMSPLRIGKIWVPPSHNVF